MVDEFACSGMLRNSLTLLHSTVERIFCVIFDVGEDDFSRANTGQMWLKLRGQDDCVQAAKVSPDLFFCFFFQLWSWKINHPVYLLIIYFFVVVFEGSCKPGAATGTLLS